MTFDTSHYYKYEPSNVNVTKETGTSDANETTKIEKDVLEKIVVDIKNNYKMLKTQNETQLERIAELERVIKEYLSAIDAIPATGVVPEDLQLRGQLACDALFKSVYHEGGN